MERRGFHLGFCFSLLLWEKWCGWWQREASVKSSRDCWTNVLNMSVKLFLFHYLLFPFLPPRGSVKVIKSSDVSVRRLLVAASPQQQ